MNYTLQQLRYLVAVADHGSVSAAARSLYVSQPGVSAAVSYLEDVFGIQCFIRHHAKGVTLTPAGQSFVAAAKNVLVQAENLHHRADELNHTIRGRITLGCFSTFGPFFLPRILSKLRAIYPELSVQIYDGDTESLLRWLRDGTIEVGLMYDINCDPAFHFKHHLTSLPPYALMHSSHPLAARPSVSPSDLVLRHWCCSITLTTPITCFPSSMASTSHRTSGTGFTTLSWFVASWPPARDTRFSIYGRLPIRPTTEAQ